MYMKKVENTSKSLVETQVLASNLLKQITPVDDFATVIFLEGDLGSGKTTFTKSLAKELGIKDTVISPTFILQKKYKINNKKYIYKNLVHIDAYRFEDPKEVKVLTLDETLKDPKNLVIIEWPSKLGKGLAYNIKIKFKSIDENTKSIIW